RFERLYTAVGKEEMEFTIADSTTKLLTDQLFQVHFVVHHQNSGRHSPLARLRRGKKKDTGPSPVHACGLRTKHDDTPTCYEERTQAFPGQKVSSSGDYSRRAMAKVGGWPLISRWCW